MFIILVTIFICLHCTFLILRLDVFCRKNLQLQVTNVLNVSVVTKNVNLWKLNNLNIKVNRNISVPLLVTVTFKWKIRLSAAGEINLLPFVYLFRCVAVILCNYVLHICLWRIDLGTPTLENAAGRIKMSTNGHVHFH